MQNSGNNLVQALEIMKGKNALTTGRHKARVIHCREDGDLIVHFDDGDETVSLVAGDDRTVGYEITISSGTFDIN